MNYPTDPMEALNQTESAYPRDQSVDDIFSKIAEQQSENVALIYGRQRMTYRELELQSNKLANVLIGYDVNPSDVVGVCMGRTIDTYIAMLAILKVGGTYLPLDTINPKHLLHFIVDNANCHMILCVEEHFELFKKCDSDFLFLKDIHRELSEASPYRPSRKNLATDVAYIMYTSGTTGRPKGVRVQHRNISRLVINTNYISINFEDVFLQLASIAFDASTFEIWGALLNGAGLAIYDLPAIDLALLQGMLANYQVSNLWLTSGLFNLVTETEIEMFAGLRHLLVGGDIVSPSHVRQVMDKFPDIQIINGYGPTEGTTFSVCHRLRRRDLDGATIPIGKPVANSRVYILDEWHKPVALGDVGELYIGGDGLSLGYIGNKLLTKEKFQEIEIDSKNQRLYRTGDLARLNIYGLIEFKGRIDRQLKVRGFRVEPQEIENCLLEIEGVTQCVVAERLNRTKDQRIVAYLVGTSGIVPSSENIRDFLKDRLPSFMLPDTFVYLDAIPLTENGKVDRVNLPAPIWKPLSAFGAETARSPLEIQVEAIWLDAITTSRKDKITDNIALSKDENPDINRVLVRLSNFYQVSLFQETFSLGGISIAILVNHLRDKLYSKENNHE